NQNQEEDNFPQKNLITWNEVLKDGDKYLLIDVRDTKSYDMCHFKNSVNLTKEGIQNYETNKIKVIVCRKGISAKKIWYELNDESILVMKGGLTAYKNEIDNKFTIF
ncbi:Adenylyltransferase and sulfurtransferase MOCS3, partial [Tubulinosema ratisbonensis]